MNNHSRRDNLDMIVLEFGEDLNTMISDPNIDFDIYSAASVTGILLTTIVESLPVDTAGKLDVTMEWFKSHLGRIAPDTRFTSGSMDTILDLLRESALDGAVPAEGPGNGN